MLKLKELKQTCSCCPSQWEGTTKEGKYVYIRCDNNELEVETAKNEEDWYKGKFKVVFVDYNSDYGDVMDTNEMLSRTGIQLI
jgi:biotin synthase-related radical SAM superfamily protein